MILMLMSPQEMHAADMLLYGQTIDTFHTDGHTSDSAQGCMTSRTCQEVLCQRHGKNRSLRIHIAKSSD